MTLGFLEPAVAVRLPSRLLWPTSLILRYSQPAFLLPHVFAGYRLLSLGSAQRCRRLGA